ncbi:hypothetical protein [Phytomonospora endophytica]|uniref:Uncharacterized protein n=1 Tax=Phytomonospora endophytica TaxID=714109 RepID=A0A841G0Z3_9ACTN|nr:hypothetical protein [Phytomonospora endophytica]MBB6039327.1 hypothetical protein [Phytomonospora endophytica]GIG69731.1 hypothetical protein Pen01_60260 [Phytomonospora endophytica]
MTTTFGGKSSAEWYEIWGEHRSRWYDASDPDSRRCTAGCGGWPCEKRNEATRRLAQAGVNPRAVLRGEEERPV